MSSFCYPGRNQLWFWKMFGLCEVGRGSHYRRRCNIPFRGGGVEELEYADTHQQTLRIHFLENNSNMDGRLLYTICIFDAAPSIGLLRWCKCNCLIQWLFTPRLDSGKLSTVRCGGDWTDTDWIQNVQSDLKSNVKNSKVKKPKRKRYRSFSAAYMFCFC